MSIWLGDRQGSQLRMSNYVLPLLALMAGPTAGIVAQTNVDATVSKPALRVTFNQDIAAIMHDKCAMCHRPGQAGPFPLLTYSDVSQRSETIQAVIDSGYMPPWKPVNENVHFANDRRLSSHQKQVIQSWIANGMPEGEASAPEPPESVDGWMLGTPDLVVTMNGQFDVPASGPDVYRSFVFPLQLSEDKWVKAVELRPTAKTSVHHAIIFIDSSGNSRKMDGQDGQAGVPGMSFLNALLSPPTSEQGILSGKLLSSWRTSFQSINAVAGMLQRDDLSNIFTQGLGGYVPGKVPAPFPGDLAVRLPQGSDIVVQTHFHPSGKPEQESGELAIYFADAPPTRRMVPIQVPPMFGIGHGIKIPAGANEHRISDSFEIPIDVEAISVFPHGHYVLREAAMSAKLPDGTTMPLVKITDWDLDWQDSYFFDQPVRLPAGTVITSELVYDNSSSNPENPYDPPREIGWGLESGDEMGSVILTVVPVNDSEGSELAETLHQYFVSSVLNPDNIVDLVMQLDIDGDGSLQRREAPPGLDSAVALLDRNNNQGLEPIELGILKPFLRTLQTFQSRSVTRSPPSWRLQLLDGTEVDPFEDAKTRAIALVFISTDCPIANAYQPRLRELDQEYRSKGVSLFLVHSTLGITSAVAHAHADDFDLSIPVVLDGDQAIAKRVGATVTPEVVVLERGKEEPIYRGSIDNLYAGYGKKRRQANKHFLKDALDQWLSGQPIAEPKTNPIGCFISIPRNR